MPHQRGISSGSVIIGIYAASARCKTVSDARGSLRFKAAARGVFYVNNTNCLDGRYVYERERRARRKFDSNIKLRVFIVCYCPLLFAKNLRRSIGGLRARVQCDT